MLQLQHYSNNFQLKS